MTLSPGFLTSLLSALARAVARAAHSPPCLLDPPASGGPYPPLRAGPFHRIPTGRLAVPPSRNGSGNAPWLAAPAESLARCALAFRVVGTARRAGPGRIRQTTPRANRARVPSPAIRRLGGRSRRRSYSLVTLRTASGPEPGHDFPRKSTGSATTLALESARSQPTARAESRPYPPDSSAFAPPRTGDIDGPYPPSAGPFHQYRPCAPGSRCSSAGSDG